MTFKRMKKPKKGIKEESSKRPKKNLKERQTELVPLENE